MRYEEWLATIPDSVKGSKLWELVAYQKACLLYDLVWRDCEVLGKDYRGKEIGRQLIRSAGSISANIEEGYGRGFGKQYSYHLGVALGSSRETAGWYLRSRHLLAPEIYPHRIGLNDEIIALLITEINRQRSRQK